MLVLSRHRNESIVIGGLIKVTIVEIRGDKVRLGIDAPSDVSVHRQEVEEAIKRNGARKPEEKEAITFRPLADEQRALKLRAMAEASQAKRLAEAREQVRRSQEIAQLKTNQP